MKIVSGKMGTPHVSSHEFRQIIDGTIGHGSYILNGCNNLEPELVSNNLLKIKSGMLAHHGNVSSVKNYDEIELANGTQGVKRIDLIVARYTRNDETKIEDSSWVLIQGTPHASSPVVPSYEVGDLQEGDLIDDCPFLEVHYDGINVVEVKKLLSVIPNISELNRNLSKHTYTVITDTTLSGTAVGSTRTISMPDLANWQEIRIMTEIGDESRMVHTIDRSIGTPFSFIVSGYASANYNGKMTVTVDWDNTAIKITPNRVAGWTVENLRITKVWGTIRI